MVEKGSKERNCSDINALKLLYSERKRVTKIQAYR